MTSAARHFLDPTHPQFRKPGSFRFTYRGTTTPSSVIVTCPCGCRAATELPLNNGKETTGWWVAGSNLTTPTVYPAIEFARENDPTKIHWRGWLLEGEWEDTRVPPKLRTCEPAVVGV